MKKKFPKEGLVRWVVVPMKFSEFCHQNRPKFLTLNDKNEPYLESDFIKAFAFDDKSIEDSFLSDAKKEFPDMKKTLDRLHVEFVEVTAK